MHFIVRMDGWMTEAGSVYSNVGAGTVFGCPADRMTEAGSGCPNI